MFFCLDALRVPLSLRGEHIHDKRYPCLYCGIMCTKLARHVLGKHHDQRLVREVLSLAKKSTEREKKLTMIRKEGAFRHNAKALKDGRGILVVERRPSKTTYQPADYKPCTVCHGFYHKTTLWKHMDKCSETKVDRLDVKMFYSAMLSDGDSTEFQKVTATMCSDDISFISQQDEIIKLVGRQLYAHHNNKKEALVSMKMRELGKLVKQVRQDTGNAELTLTDIIHPRFYDQIVASTRKLCKFKVSDKTGSTPSLAMKIGHGIKKAAAIIRNKGIREEDAEVETRIRQYLLLHTTEWGSNITRYALDALEEKRTTPVLPVTTDLEVGM